MRESEMGIRIRTGREGLGMSRQDMARRMGIRFSTLVNIERGTVRLKAGVLCKIAGALNCSADYILGLQNEKEKALSQR